MRTIFIGTAGFLGRIDSETRCAFWADDPVEHGFDPARLIEVDLSYTPTAASSGRIGWDAVQVEDCFSLPNGNLAGTTLGPQWPEMQLTGMVWLAQKYVLALPAVQRPVCPPVGAEGRDYEFQSVAYWDGSNDARASRRYSGHHGIMLREHGSLAQIAVYPPGSSLRATARPTKRWIDLSSPDECDAGLHSLTTISLGQGKKEGAIFLANGSVQAR